jgi:hypothetical protein
MEKDQGTREFDFPLNRSTIIPQNRPIYLILTAVKIFAAIRKIRQTPGRRNFCTSKNFIAIPLACPFTLPKFPKPARDWIKMVRFSDYRYLSSSLRSLRRCLCLRFVRRYFPYEPLNRFPFFVRRSPLPIGVYSKVLCLKNIVKRSYSFVLRTGRTQSSK